MTLSITTDQVPLKLDADGVVRVGGTRVTLDTVVTAFEEGLAAEEIAHQYPPVQLADMYAVIGFYLRHRPDVDAYLCERRRKADEVRKQNEARFPSHGIRERLLARRASMAEEKA